MLLHNRHFKWMRLVRKWRIVRWYCSISNPPCSGVSTVHFKIVNVCWMHNDLWVVLDILNWKRVWPPFKIGYKSFLLWCSWPNNIWDMWNNFSFDGCSSRSKTNVDIVLKNAENKVAWMILQCVFQFSLNFMIIFCSCQ